ncbi:MAG: TIGR00725 family protein [Thermodesulfobacteriota bacterium]
MASTRARLVSVIGAGTASGPTWQRAHEVGRLLAQKGFGVVTGGLGGVMEAAAMGCAQAGGLSVGILPGGDPAAANPWCRVVIPSGMGQARNVLVIAAGLGAIAISGGAGTLSEIGHALKLGKPVVGLDTWELPGLPEAENPEEAVELLLDRLHG